MSQTDQGTLSYPVASLGQTGLQLSHMHHAERDAYFFHQHANFRRCRPNTIGDDFIAMLVRADDSAHTCPDLPVVLKCLAKFDLRYSVDL